MSASGDDVGIGGGTNLNGFEHQKGTDGNNITIQDNAYVSAKGRKRGIGGTIVGNRSYTGGSAKQYLHHPATAPFMPREASAAVTST